MAGHVSPMLTLGYYENPHKRTGAAWAREAAETYRRVVGGEVKERLMSIPANARKRLGSANAAPAITICVCCYWLLPGSPAQALAIQIEHQPEESKASYDFVHGDDSWRIETYAIQDLLPYPHTVYLCSRAPKPAPVPR